MFWQDGYQKSIYLDSDMLCIKDFSEIVLNNNGGITWKVPNLGTVVVGEKILGKDTYYRFIDTALKHYQNDPMGDQNTLIHLYGSGKDVTTIGDAYNFQDWGGGGKGSNKNFLNHLDNVKIIHYSGRRKPWGGVYDGMNFNNKNCMSYPYMCYHSEPVKLWFKYYEEFKINHISGNSPFETYQLVNGIILEDTI
jgi:lipopolysaccharide biosynthesis glycosyltransferase